jgi:hypothetical protein
MILCGTLLMQPNDVSLMSCSGLTVSMLQALCPHITGLCGLHLLIINVQKLTSLNLRVKDDNYDDYKTANIKI